LDEARAVLSTEELDVASRYWDIGELGDMHHSPAKNVLHRKVTVEELQKQTGNTAQEVQRIVGAARSKLLAARLQRPTPFIDRTLYTGWNAMAVTAYLETARILRSDATRDFALLTLNRILADAWDGAETLYHVIAYSEGDSDGGSQARVLGTLDDYAFTVHACIDAWMASGEMRQYDAAIKLADAMISRFYDHTAGAFYDTATSERGEMPLGALSARRKPLQDSPTPAGNPTAASALLRLEALSGRTEYREIAEDTLGSFTGIVEHFGLYAGSYGLALERLLLDPLQVVIVGSPAESEALEALAVAGYAIQKSVFRISPERLVPGGVPEVLAETLLKMPSSERAKAWAFVCRGRSCMPPVTDSDALLEVLDDAPRVRR
jgi:uncharacterized protein YyaL (SSP411 family)